MKKTSIILITFSLFVLVSCDFSELLAGSLLLSTSEMHILTLDYGNTTESYSYEKGESLSLPKANQIYITGQMAEIGYEFAGWVDSSGQGWNDGDKMPGYDMVLTAVWKLKVYSVDFLTKKYSSHIEHNTQLVEHGNMALRPKDPSRLGFTFVGWYSDEDCSSQYDFYRQIKSETHIYAKWSSEGLSSITIPDSTTSIDDYAFERYYSLENIVIPDSVTCIGKGAFLQCDGLKSVNIPSSVISIGEYAFRWCSNLESIEIPSSVTSIGRGVFWECFKLARINFKGTQKQWEDLGFDDIPEKCVVVYEYQ